MQKKQFNILIAGELDKLEKALLHSFIFQDHKVIVIADSLDIEYLEKFKSKYNAEDNLEIIIDNVNKRTFVKSIMLELENRNIKNIDIVINLMCKNSFIKNNKDVINNLDTCYIGTINMLDITSKLNSQYIQVLPKIDDFKNHSDIAIIDSIKVLVRKYCDSKNIHGRIVTLTECEDSLTIKNIAKLIKEGKELDIELDFIDLNSNFSYCTSVKAKCDINRALIEKDFEVSQKFEYIYPLYEVIECIEEVLNRKAIFKFKQQLYFKNITHEDKHLLLLNMIKENLKGLYE